MCQSRVCRLSPNATIPVLLSFLSYSFCPIRLVIHHIFVFLLGKREAANVVQAWIICCSSLSLSLFYACMPKISALKCTIHANICTKMHPGAGQSVPCRGETKRKTDRKPRRERRRVQGVTLGKVISRDGEREKVGKIEIKSKSGSSSFLALSRYRSPLWLINVSLAHRY